jgi:hypothetical protein
VAERFRLIYLKSTKTEDATSDQFRSSYEPERVSENLLLETISSQAILRQAKAILEEVKKMKDLDLKTKKAVIKMDADIETMMLDIKY